MKKTVDGKNIVVIGGGIGGLSAGIVLSILDYDVTVVEKNILPGGLTRSYRRGKEDCPVGVHYVGALGDNEPLGKMFNYLGIDVSDLFEKMGQEGVIDRYIFDEFTFDLPTGIDEYQSRLLELFPDEARAINLLAANIRMFSRQMLEPSFILNMVNPFQNIEFFISLGDFLRQLGVSDHLREVLAAPVHLIGVPVNECPIIFHHMTLAGYLFSSWRPKGCGEKIADVISERFRKIGGNLIVNDGVENILMKAEKVSGLQLKSGRYLPADAVVAAIHPKALLKLLPADTLKESFRQRVFSLKETEGVLGVQVMLNADTHPQLLHNVYRLPAKNDGLKKGFYFQLRRGSSRKTSLLSLVAPSSYSDWSQWIDTKSGRRGQEYQEKKMNIAEELLGEASKILGGIRSHKIIDVFTPLTLRDYVDCPDGSCYGLMRSTNQLLKLASLSNFPLAGLYLAGQNAVAPGVLGSMLGAFQAARQIAGADRCRQKFNFHLPIN